MLMILPRLPELRLWFGEEVASEVAAEGPDCHEVDLQDHIPVYVWEFVWCVSFLDAGAGE